MSRMQRNTRTSLVDWRVEGDEGGDYTATYDGQDIGAVWRDGPGRWSARWRGRSPLGGERFSTMREAQVWVERMAQDAYSSDRPRPLPASEPKPKGRTWVVFEVTTKRLYALEGDETQTEYNGLPPAEVEQDWFRRKRGTPFSLGTSHASRDPHEIGFSEEVVSVTHKVVDRDGFAEILRADG